MKKIDLKFKSNLDEAISSKFNEISRDKIDEFHNFISKISKDNINILEWWMSSPSSRYTLASPLYFNFCSVYLLIFILENDIKIDLIEVDNIEIKKLFDNIIKNYNKKIVIICKYYLFKKIKNMIRGYLSIFFQFITKFFQLIIVRFINVDYTELYKKNIILIDKFIYPGYIEKERYYPGLISKLDINFKKKVFFVPAIFHVKIFELFKVYKKLNNSNYNYLFKEKFISFFDLFDSFLFFKRKTKILLKDNLVCGHDLSKVIRSEINNNMISYLAAIESFLTIKFIKNIRELNIDIKLAIDWFENQINDRGWNYGFNHYFPEIKTKGYRGLIPSDLLLSEMYPTEDENIHGMLPKTICIIGPSLNKDIKKYIKNIDIEVAPAFRFQHIWEKEYLPSKNEINIFVALPISFDDSIFITNLVFKSLKKINLNKYNIYIKPHPTTTISILKKYLEADISESVKFIDGHTQDILFKSNILISGMSSICLESIAIGIPLIIVENKNKLNYRTVPKDISKNLYKYCYNEKDIIDAIDNFINKSEKNKQSNNIEIKKIKSNYFCKVTKYNIDNFFM